MLSLCTIEVSDKIVVRSAMVFNCDVDRSPNKIEMRRLATTQFYSLIEPHAILKGRLALNRCIRGPTGWNNARYLTVSFVRPPTMPADDFNLRMRETFMWKMLKILSSFGLGSARRGLIGRRRFDSPDLRNLSDRSLEDIGLPPRKTDLDASKPFWLA